MAAAAAAAPAARPLRPSETRRTDAGENFERAEKKKTAADKYPRMELGARTHTHMVWPRFPGEAGGPRGGGAFVSGSTMQGCKH